MHASSEIGVSRPFRILMTADAVGGVWQYAIELTRELCDRGAEVLLATMGPRPNEEQRKRVHAIAGAQLAESDFALEWMPDAWKQVDAAGEWLLKVAASFRPDVIHVNGYAHASLAWDRPVVVVVHSCVYSWWRAVHGCAPPDEWSEYKRRVAAGIAGSDAIVAITRFMAAACATEYGVPQGKIRVIHNFDRTPSAAAIAKKSYCFAAGRMWDAAKNLRLLDEIAPRLNWEIRVAGNNKGPENSAASAHSVRLLGFLSDAELADEMYAAGILLHPALYEPFGLTVLHAAHAGCCLVLSDIPSLRELWSGAAVFINPRDPERWVGEVNALISNPVRRHEFGERAMRHAQRYSAKGTVEDYWQAYRDAMRIHERKESAA